MTQAEAQLIFFLTLAKTQAALTRRFDRGLGGLGFNEFVILRHLNQTPGDKLSRVELAEKLGLTASGITRLLLPMEKVGLVKRLASAEDGRISYVAIASGGKRQLEESLDRARRLCQELLPPYSAKRLTEFNDFLTELGQKI